MKILVFCLPGIGDSLMATPMVKLLKEKLPGAEIDVACMLGGVEYVFKNNPNINDIYRLSLYGENKLKGLMQTLKLRKKKYDVSILAFPCYRREYHLVHFLAGAKKRIAHRFKSGYFTELHWLNTDLIEVDENEHNVINNLNLLKALGISWETEIKKENIRYDLSLDKEDVEFGKEYVKNLGWENRSIIGIHPGSTNSPAALLRRWPVERYAEVAKFLISEKKKKVLIFVGPDEIDLGSRLSQLVNDKDNCHLLQDISFGQSLGVLDQVEMLICNDNGFGHLAVALGKKIVTLWASTNDKWSLPYDRDLVTLVRPENFKPWYRYDLKRVVPKGLNSGIGKIETSQVMSRINL